MEQGYEHCEADYHYNIYMYHSYMALWQKRNEKTRYGVTRDLIR